MKKTKKVRMILGVVALGALGLTAIPGPAAAEPLECSDFLSTGPFDEAFSGLLIGQKRVTARMGWGSIYVEEQFWVGTFRDFSTGREFVVRCDTYELYLFA